MHSVSEVLCDSLQSSRKSRPSAKKCIVRSVSRSSQWTRGASVDVLNIASISSRHILRSVVPDQRRAKPGLSPFLFADQREPGIEWDHAG